MVNKRTVVDGNLDGTGGKKKTMKQKLGDKISESYKRNVAAYDANTMGSRVNKPKPLTKAEKAELKIIGDIQNKKNAVKNASNAGVNAEAAGVATEDPMARMKRATGQTGMKKGGMAKKGYAMGGMMKKGYAKGGPTKKKGAKKGGKVRGVGIAKKGFRPVKMR